jgi:hypothetical protein
MTAFIFQIKIAEEMRERRKGGKARFPLYLNSCPASPNLCGKSRLALPGITTGAIIAEAIFGETDSKA